MVSQSSAASLADFTPVVPAQTMADDQGTQKTSLLPVGSVFEVMVLKLKTLKGEASETKRARHTNMK